MKKSTKKQKFSIKDIFQSLRMTDPGCLYFCILAPKYKNKIGFFNDEDGNGGPYLEMTWFKEYLKITGGSHLCSDEKGNLFPYCDYDSVDQFVDYVIVFTTRYFGSIEKQYVRK